MNVIVGHSLEPEGVTEKSVRMNFGGVCAETDERSSHSLEQKRSDEFRPQNFCTHFLCPAGNRIVGERC